LQGGDKDMLLASLRTDGAPASIPGYAEPAVAVAEREKPVRTAALETNRQNDAARRSVVERSEDQDDDAAPAAASKRERSADGEAPLPPTRPYGLGVSKTKPAETLAQK
jgi:rare lipoprotein A